MDKRIDNQLKNLKLLYVEDDELTREMLESLLLRITDNLIVRSNGLEGLEAYKEYAPDIVISDIRMPVMNGLEMVKNIKAINKDAAIIFISAYKDPALVVKVIELDVKRFLFKPVKLKEIKEVLVSISKEINAQKELQVKEKEIEQEKSLTEKILNTQNSIVLLTTKEDEIVKANNRFFDFFSFESLDEFKSKKKCICNLLIKEEGLVSSHEEIQKIADVPDKSKKNRAKVYDIDGNVVTFSIAAEKVVLNFKDHYVITLNDITLEEKALEKAKDIDRIKSEFFTNMSHEIRTPINGIIGFADLLEESLKQKELKHYAGIISSSAKSLLNIINDILDYSKIEENKLNIENVSANIPREAESVAELFYATVMEKKLDILLKIDPFFPDCVISDPLRIRQVLSNLVSNSVKFTPEDGKIIIELKYLCSVKDECAQLYLSVVDTGIGIAKDQQQKIFEAFSQADTTTTREFGGTGLGLTISSRLVSLLGSELKLESELGKGSKFYFTIDIEECETGASRLPAFKPQKEKIAVYAEGYQEGSQQKLLCDYLRLFGFKTECFSYESDLSLLKNGDNFDLLFMFEAVKEKDISRLKEISKKSIYVSRFIDDYRSKDADEILYYPLYGSKIYKIIEEVARGVKNKKSTKRVKRVSYHSNILVVEDNQVNQKLVSIILEKLGCSVKVANNGLEAISVFKSENFDLIFMDINMPLMDGIEAAKEIIAIERHKNIAHTPIVAITANIQKEDKNRFISAGMDDYLPKPISKKNVEEMVSKYINLKVEYCEEEVMIDMASDDTLDFEAALKGLGISGDTMIELIQEFLDNFIGIRSDLEDAIEIGDINSGKYLAHKIKGASGNLRMNKLYNLFKDLEQTIQDKERSKALLGEIFKEVEVVRERVNKAAI